MLLMWLFNSRFVMQPFAGFAFPNPILSLPGANDATDNHPWLMLGNSHFWGSIFVQHAFYDWNRTDHRSGLY